MTYEVSNVSPYLAAHDRTETPALSFVRDGAVFAYLVIIFTANIDLLDLSNRSLITSNASLEGSLFSQISVVIFFSIGILLQIFGQVPVRRVIVTAAPLVPMLIWIILSVTWSEFQDVSLRRAVRLLMETITIILFAAAYKDQYRLLKVIYLSFGFILITDIAFLSMPELSFSPTGFVGVHDSKQETGIFCLVALPIFLLPVIDRGIFPLRIIPMTLLLGCLAILVISSSKSALAFAPVCFFLTIVVVFVRRAHLVTAFAMIVILVCVALIAVMIASATGENILIYMFGDRTLTGRDRIWSYALSLFWQSPIFGHGYGSIWNVGTYSILQLPNMSEFFLLKSAHNGYIDIMAALGGVGLFLAIVFLITVFFRLQRRTPLASVRQINFIATYTFITFLLDNSVRI